MLSPPFFLLSDGDVLNILALDQARNGAWSVFDYETKQLVGYGTFAFDVKKYTYAKTILHIEEIITAVIDAYDIEAIFIEDIQLRANVQAFKKLAQLQGVLVNLCEKNEYLYELIAPSQWQNYCRGQDADFEPTSKKGSSETKESKMMSIHCVKELFDIETDNDNLADAICLGLYAVNKIEIMKKKK